MGSMILDGHNDLAYRVWGAEEPRHIDLAAAEAVGFSGGFFALSAPGPTPLELPSTVPYERPLEPSVGRDNAVGAVLGQLDALHTLDVHIVRTADEIAAGRVNAIVHLEGAEPIDPDLSDLEEWYSRGVRSIGLVWSRSNAFGHGVPFRFPGSPDTGPGLTPEGFDLVRACNDLGILIDVSHLNETGFWDVGLVTEFPIVATHSNVHALCASPRNLTERQLRAIADSNGVVGVNFGTAYLREDGRNEPTTPVLEIVRHIEHLVELIGADHVALGSDFEGVGVPDELGGIQGLPRLVALLASRFDEATVAKITHGNWLRVIRETWRT